MPILFITSTHIGDGILSTGLLAHLMAAYPDQRFTIACGAPAAKVFAAAPRVDAIHVLRKRKHHLHWYDLWRATAFRRWDLIVDLRRTIMPWILWSRRAVSIPKSQGSMHRVELNGAALGIGPPDPVVWTTDAHRQEAEDILGDDARPVVALGPGATWIGKTWPAERFAELAQWLTGPEGPAPGARLLLTGGPDERAVAAPIFETFPDADLVDGFGVDVLTTYELLRRCRIMVANDSAMMHLAAAAGIPTVGLFGPTREDRYAPWGANSLVVRTPESADELWQNPDLDHANPGKMMLTLEVDRVVAGIRERWPEL